MDEEKKHPQVVSMHDFDVSIITGCELACQDSHIVARRDGQIIALYVRAGNYWVVFPQEKNGLVFQEKNGLVLPQREQN